MLFKSTTYIPLLPVDDEEEEGEGIIVDDPAWVFLEDGMFVGVLADPIFDAAPELVLETSTFYEEDDIDDIGLDEDDTANIDDDGLEEEDKGEDKEEEDEDKGEDEDELIGPIV